MTYGTPRPEAVQQVLRDNRVHYDLTDPEGRPLTRNEVGFQAGYQSLTIAHPGGQPYIDVTVDLLGQHQLQADVSDITFSAMAMDPEREIDPHSLDLARTYPTVDDAYAELVAFADQFGLDTNPPRPDLDQFRHEAKLLIREYQHEGSFNSYRTFVWYSPLSTDTFKLGVTAAVFASTGRVSLRYMLRWPPSPAFGIDVYDQTK